MRVLVLLCDHAQVADGKLFIHGAGISRIGKGAPTSVAILIYVPWNDTNRAIKYGLQLETADGRSSLPTLDGEDQLANINVSGEFEVGRPPGAVAGVPLEVPVATNFPPLQNLVPGRYVWRVSIDNETRDDWTAAFELMA